MGVEPAKQGYFNSPTKPFVYFIFFFWRNSPRSLRTICTSCTRFDFNVDLHIFVWLICTFSLNFTDLPVMPLSKFYGFFVFGSSVEYVQIVRSVFVFALFVFFYIKRIHHFFNAYHIQT